MSTRARGRALALDIAVCMLIPFAAATALATPAAAPPGACDAWQARLAQLQQAGSGYLVGRSSIAPAVTAAAAQRRAGELALTDLIQQISSRVDSVTSVRESSGAAAEHRVSLELTLRSRLSLRSSTKEDCYDAAKLEYWSRVSVEREVLLRAALAELAARNADGQQAVARSQRALDSGDPLGALRDLVEARHQLELAEDEAVVVRALGDGGVAHCFSTRGELEQLGQRARDAAPLRLVFPPEMDGLEASVRAMFGGLQLRAVDKRPLVELRGSFRGISEPVLTPNHEQVMDAIVNVDIVLVKTGTIIDSVQAPGRDGDRTRSAVLRRISEHTKPEVIRLLRQKLVLAYGTSLEPDPRPDRGRSPGLTSGRARAAGIAR